MSIDLSLERISKLFAHLPVPYTRPTIHVAGTNGKGSVCAYVSSILSSAGLAVGRFNTPHLLSIFDSISVRGKPISPEVFGPIVMNIEEINAAQGTRCSNFELFTCAALMVFERTKVDVVVLEVGMGGRLDATNILPNEAVLVSALTSVDLDHQALLGDTVEKIAREKVAIARPGKPFVLGHQEHSSVNDVAKSMVEEIGSALLPACNVTTVEWDETLDGSLNSTEVVMQAPLLQPVAISMPPFSTPIRALLPLHGQHQLENLGTAAGIISALLTHPSCVRPALNLQDRLTPDVFARGIKATRWPGRLSYHNVSLPANPTSGVGEERLLVLADGAHNPASATALAAYLTSLLATPNAARRPLTLTYILALSHSPPKTPEQTLAPLLAVRTQVQEKTGREVNLGAALLGFTLPQRMPWISAVPPAEMNTVVDALASSGCVEVWRDPREGTDDLRGPLDGTELEKVKASPYTAHVERALRWAAARAQAAEGEDSLVVLAGSLYLVADFYRLLQKLGQGDEIWGGVVE